MRYLSTLAALALLSASHTAQHSELASTANRCCRLFPAATGPLAVNVTADGPNLLELASSYAELTDQNLVLDDRVKALLEQSHTGLEASVSVPAREVQSFFEQVLVGNEIVVEVVRTDAPRVVRLRSLNQKSSAFRSRAHLVAPGELDHFAKHPATLIKTTVALPNSDSRQLATSLRALMTENRTQSIIAAGDSHSLIVTDFGSNAAALVELLQLVDGASVTAQSARHEFTVIPLEHATAASAMATLSAVIRPWRGLDSDGNSRPAREGDPRIFADVRTNSLVVAAGPDDMRTIRALTEQLDREHAE